MRGPLRVLRLAYNIDILQSSSRSPKSVLLAFLSFVYKCPPFARFALCSDGCYWFKASSSRSRCSINDSDRYNLLTIPAFVTTRGLVSTSK